MLNSALLQFNAAGQIRWTTALPKYFNGGTPMNSGLLCCNNASPTRYNAGIGYVVGDSLAIDDILADPVTTAAGGVPLTDSGRVAVDINAVPIWWANGLPISINGRVCFATAELPPTVRGFSNGFSAGFK